jgi:hypothetical protein
VKRIGIGIQNTRPSLDSSPVKIRSVPCTLENSWRKKNVRAASAIMKRTMVPGVCEEAEYLCDVTGKSAVARLTLKFVYPADHDGQMLEADLGNEPLTLLQAEYPQLKLVDYFP